jgi:uncharacterized delta-60 repeat protein
MKVRSGSYTALVLGLVLNALGHAQAPLSLDQEFSISHNTWYVSSVLPMEDGKVLASGQLRNAGDILFKSMLRFNADGSVDPNFNSNGIGGGQMVRWNDKIYVAGTQTVRRIQLSGIADPTFQHMNNDELFSSLQGGDYHVYPDGSILMSGAHSLYDTARGFVGIYNLIWFTNTGHLDTTKTHRYCNGVIYEIEQQPDGKFLCSGTCSTYEGQPVRRVFRVHADGALDTSFDSQVVGGSVFEFLPLPDGRVYTAGRISRANAIEDTIQVARFLSNGDLDPTFNALNDFDLGELPTTIGNPNGLASSLSAWPGGQLLVTGFFQLVNGQQRKGICVLDSLGNLSTAFHNSGVGPYTYQGFVYGGIDGAVLTPDNMLYVYGAYHGYTDGTTNDPDQRFITRLYGPDLSTAVSDATAIVPQTLRVTPNPNNGHFILNLPADLGPTQARLLDASGRVVQQYMLRAGTEQQHLSAAAEPGAYVLVVEGADGQRWQARVVVE